MVANTRAQAAPAASTLKRKAAAPAEKASSAKKVATAPATKKAVAPVAAKKEVATKKAAATPKPVKKTAPVKKETKTPAPKTTRKQPVTKEATPEQEEQEEDDEEEDEEGLMDDKELLKGIDSSAEEDSSDEEAEDAAILKEDSFAAMKDEIALNPKAAADVKKRLGDLKNGKKSRQGATPSTGVVYLGRIPHGFYEEQMQAYFSQFGKVVRLRLSRNKKTGKSKHYAFIEFTTAEVADIVADTMDNYLLFGHQLKCKALTPAQVHPAMFLGANKKFKAIPWLKISKEKHNAEKSTEQVKAVTKKLLKKESAKRAKLQELGIDYDFPGYSASVKEKPKHIKF